MHFHNRLLLLCCLNRRMRYLGGKYGRQLIFLFFCSVHFWREMLQSQREVFLLWLGLRFCTRCPSYLELSQHPFLMLGMIEHGLCGGHGVLLIGAALVTRIFVFLVRSFFFFFILLVYNRFIYIFVIGIFEWLLLYSFLLLLLRTTSTIGLFFLLLLSPPTAWIELLFLFL